MKTVYQLDKYEMNIATMYIAVAIEEQPHMISDTAEARALINMMMADEGNCLDAINICKDFIQQIEG